MQHDASIDIELGEFLRSQGYTLLVDINGVVCGVSGYMFTWGLHTHVDFGGYRTRYCYQLHHDAEAALLLWNGLGDPPGPWIKQKGGVDRHNPLLYTHIGGTHWERNNVSEAEVWMHYLRTQEALKRAA